MHSPIARNKYRTVRLKRREIRIDIFRKKTPGCQQVHEKPLDVTGHQEMQIQTRETSVVTGEMTRNKCGGGDGGAAAPRKAARRFLKQQTWSRLMTQKFHFWVFMQRNRNTEPDACLLVCIAALRAVAKIRKPSARRYPPA